MAIAITTRTSTQTTGGSSDSIAGEGTIDTPAEATAALAKLPAGGAIVVGDQTYNQARLEAIRDGRPDTGNPAPVVAPVAPVVPPAAPVVANPAPDATASIPVEHPSGYLGVGLRGGYSFAFGDYAHSGPMAQIFGERSFRIGSSDIFFVPQLTLDYRGGNKDYTSPGGEALNSHFNLLGGGLNAMFRFAPTGVLDGRLNFDAGLGLGIAGLMTPANTYEDLPRITGDCPDGLGRAQCAGAYPGHAITGATGLRDTRTGGSRDAEGGMALQFRLPLGVSYQIPVGANAVSLDLLFQPGYWTINPHTGSGGGMWDLTVGGGAAFHF